MLHFILIAASLHLAAPEQGRGDLIQERIIARVGKEIITSTDVDLLVLALSKSPQATDERTLKEQARQKLIDEILISQFLERRQIAVADKEIESRFQAIKTSSGAASPEEFNAILSRQGMTPEKLKAQIRRQLEIAQFRSFIEAKARRNIDEREVIAYYKNNADNFKTDVEVELQECFLASDDKTDQQALEKRAEVYIKNPSTFAACVSQWSVSPSRKNQGDVGKFQKGILPPEIERKVFSAKQGAVVPVQQGGAIQLLKIKKVRNRGPLSLDSAREKIRDLLNQESIGKEIDRVLAEERASASVQIF